MSIIARQQDTSFVPAPVGTYAATCVDVEDLGMQPNHFKPGEQVHNIRLCWQIAERMPDGRPYLASRLYRLSLHPQSALRQHIDTWNGALTPAQLQGFDVETLIGRSCLVSIIHNVKPDGRVFANVDTVLALPKGMAAPAPDGSYVRKCNRPLPSAPRSYLPDAPSWVNGNDDDGGEDGDPIEYEASGSPNTALDQEAFEHFCQQGR
jgi:hypothetical protein